MEKHVEAETRSLGKVCSDLGRERPSHFKTPREKDTSEPSRRHEYFQNLTPRSLTLRREIPSHFQFRSKPIIQIVTVLSSTRFVDFVGSLADPLLNLVWRLDYP
jgi:hypothetical protein